jgi:hypothetical protein
MLMSALVPSRCTKRPNASAMPVPPPMTTGLNTSSASAVPTAVAHGPGPRICSASLMEMAESTGRSDQLIPVPVPAKAVLQKPTQARSTSVAWRVEPTAG